MGDSRTWNVIFLMDLGGWRNKRCWSFLGRWGGCGNGRVGWRLWWWFWTDGQTTGFRESLERLVGSLRLDVYGRMGGKWGTRAVGGGFAVGLGFAILGVVRWSMRGCLLARFSFG